MKMMNRLAALFLALLMLALPALAEGSPDDVLVTVNGRPVTRAAFEAELTLVEDFYASYGYDVTDPTIAPILQQIALESVVEYAVLDCVIEENSLQLTDAELADAAQIAREDFNMQVDLLVDEYGYYGLADISTEEGRAATMVTVLAQLEEMGITEASYIAQAQTYAAYDKVYAWVVADVTVTEEEVLAHYESLVEADRIAYANDVPAYEAMLDNNEMALLYGMPEYYVDLYYVPEGYRVVTHILLAADETALADYAAVTADPNATPEMVAEAEAAVIASVQPDLDEIHARMEAGESFNALIPEYTIDPGMQAEASIAMGYEVHPQSTAWVTPFRDAACAIDTVGGLSEPVVTNYGVHIICYVSDVPGGPVPYTSDVQALLTESLLAPRQAAVYEEALQGWISEAEIVYSPEAQAILNGN